MKIMKLLAACAMVGALATTSAMAEEFLGEYDATNNSIAIDLASEAVTTYVSDNNITGDLTVLVTDIETGTIANTNIFQIDQGTLAALDNDGVEGTATAVLKLSADVATDYANIQASTDETASSVYYVRLGGAESGYIEDFFVFTAPKQEEPDVPETVELAVGDIDGNGIITTDDATNIAKTLVGLYIPDMSGYAAASLASDDEILTTDDATCIKYFAATMYDRSVNVGYYGQFYEDEDGYYILSGDLYF